MSEFSAIVLIITGILQIILFFKIWGMTNDVNELKERFKANTLADDIRIAYLNGEKEIAEEILHQNYSKAFEALDQTNKGYDFASNSYCDYIDSTAKEKYTKIINELREVAEKYNLSLPTE